jgi:hypothetical protein
MTWVRDTIIEHPEIAVFLALGVGFFVGRFSDRGIGLGNGRGFDGPERSVRVSLANLRDEDHTQIHRSLRAIGKQHFDEWRDSGAGRAVRP